MFSLVAQKKFAKERRQIEENLCEIKFNLGNNLKIVININKILAIIIKMKINI
jgi:hypothetical protein